MRRLSMAVALVVLSAVGLVLVQDLNRPAPVYLPAYQTFGPDATAGADGYWCYYPNALPGPHKPRVGPGFDRPCSQEEVDGARAMSQLPWPAEAPREAAGPLVAVA